MVYAIVRAMERHFLRSLSVFIMIILIGLVGMYLIARYGHLDEVQGQDSTQVAK